MHQPVRLSLSLHPIRSHLHPVHSFTYCHLSRIHFNPTRTATSWASAWWQGQAKYMPPPQALDFREKIKIEENDYFLLLLFLVGWDWVHLVLRLLLAYTSAIGGMKIGRGNRSTQRTPSAVQLCPPQISHDLTRTWTRAAAEGSQRLTAWAMTRPKNKKEVCLVLIININVSGDQ
jgi:hypothetical protein